MTRISSIYGRGQPEPCDPDDDEMQRMARRAWQERGWLCVPMASITDEWQRRDLEALGNRLYGERIGNGKAA